MLSPTAILTAIRQRPQIMGILNVTPDSFSDGGLHLDPSAALNQSKAMAEAGASILDIGGESTRPGAAPVSETEERARVMPVLNALRQTKDDPASPFAKIAISIDTTKPALAREAVQAGAAIINDIWGLQSHPDMAHVVAETGAAIIIMHNRHSVEPALDIMADLHNFFARSLEIAAKASISTSHIILDPGIGFGKTQAQNLICLRELSKLKAFNLPILLGVSRKSLFGHVLGIPVDQRLTGTLCANMLGLQAGADILRVHDVAPHVQAVTLFEAIKEVAA